MLEQIDLTLRLDHDKYEKDLSQIQLQLVHQEQKLREAGIPMIIMYEGWDASGKGGSIMRITEKMDPRGCHVWPISAPDETELQHHYLWRFWTRLPGRGQIAIFDRSWYGRVLVERVEKLATKTQWSRAYREIRDFEQMLIDDGAVLVKFWMHISKNEQKKRFEEREKDPYKTWKITKEDWRNRDKWDEYVTAAEQMLAETSTLTAPWSLISAEDKNYARVATARIVSDRMKQALDNVKA